MKKLLEKLKKRCIILIKKYNNAFYKWIKRNEKFDKLAEQLKKEAYVLTKYQLFWKLNEKKEG